MTPRQLQESLNAISEELFAACQEMASIASEKGTSWLGLRASCKTNGECDQKWAASDTGKRENYLKWYIKGLTAKRGAILQETKSNNGTW